MQDLKNFDLSIDSHRNYNQETFDNLNKKC